MPPGQPRSALRRAIAHKVPPPGSVKPQKRRQIENAEALKYLYLEALPKVYTITAALKAAGATLRQLSLWREQDDEFAACEEAARAAIADQLESEAIRRGYKGVRKPVYQGGLLAGYTTEYSDPLLMFTLKAMRPEKYRERSDITVNPIVKVVAGFDPADLL